MRIGHGYGKVFGALCFGSCFEVMEWLRKKGLDTRKFISSSNFPQGVPAFVRIIIFYEGHRHRCASGSRGDRQVLGNLNFPYYKQTKLWGQ